MSEEEIIEIIKQFSFDEYEWWIADDKETTREEDCIRLEQAIQRFIRFI